jgi:hypothetical protein
LELNARRGPPVEGEGAPVRFSRRAIGSGLVIGLVLAAPLRAQPPAGRPRPRLAAVPVAVPPVLDGAVDLDPAWTHVPAATGFVQTSPDEGRPASERTEVRVAYTADTLYVGVICFDQLPGEIVRAEGRRDSALDKVDSFRVLLDTYHDRQNAFVFGTTPAGAEFDGQVINDGGGNDFTQGGQQGGSLAGFNLNWDGAWEVRTRIGPYGWSAELAIPLRTLRYGAGGRQTWGLNFQRVIQRRNETAFWAPLGRQQTLHRVSEAGVLDGLDLPAQRNLKLIPYVLGEVKQDYLGGTGQKEGANAGGDLKYSLTPSLTLDATLRTDFAQVEVDEQQLQLNRFNLFFPEKRPFFLENAGLFAVGLPGEVELFFSRRIGIGANGEVIPIVGGARLSGKVGRARLGLLDMQTERVDDAAVPTPANNFTVTRFAYELGNRSSVGVFFSNRQATTPKESWQGDYGRTYAADARLGIGRYGLVSGFLAGTQAPGAPAKPYAWNASAQYDAPAWLLDLKTSQVGGGFDPQIGFLRRRDYTRVEALVLHRYRPENLFGLKELRPHVFSYGVWKPDGFLESGFLHIDNYTEWKNGFEIHTGVNFVREGVRPRFQIDPKRDIWVEEGTYDSVETVLYLETPPALPVSLVSGLVAGGYFGGRRFSPNGELRVRVRELFTGALRWEHNRISLPGGDFIVNLGRLRLSYSFTPRTFIQALVQWNDRLDVWSTNVRLGWLRDANTGLFVVYNENRGIGAEDNPDPRLNGWGVRDRRLVVKLSWLFDLLR